MKLHDKEFELFIGEDALQSEIVALAETLNANYHDKHVVFLAVLNGAFMFASDILKRISLSCEVSFIKLASYEGLTSKGEIQKLIGLNQNLAGKHVVILEDIVDTGQTIHFLLNLIEEQNPASLEVCTLFYKPQAFKGENKPKYIGYTISNRFVVGYGLDYNELGRNSREVYQLKEEALN